MTKDKEYVITPIDGTSWDVWNETENIRYRVDDLGDKGWTCTCPHWYHRLRHSKGICKHIQKVKDLNQ